MTDEDNAFIDAYISCFGASSRQFVEDVIGMYKYNSSETANEDHHGSESIKVMDAYLLWHMAVKCSLNIMRTA